MRKQVICNKGYYLIWIVKIKIGIGTILQFDIKMTSCYNNIRLNGKRTWQTKKYVDREKQMWYYHEAVTQHHEKHFEKTLKKEFDKTKAS